MADRTLRWLFGSEGEVALERDFQVVVAATAMSVTGIFVVSPIVADVAGPLEVSPARAGQLITVFSAPSIPLVPIVGMAADRIGRKLPLVVGLVVFGVAGAVVALAETFRTALVLRTLQGVGYAIIIPVTVTVIGDLYTGARESTAQGLRIGGIQSMNLLSPPLAGLLVLGSWRYPFLLFAAALLIAAWAWVALPEAQPGAATSVRAYAADLVASLRRPVVALVMASFAVRFGLVFGFYAYVSVLLARTIGATSLGTGVVVAGYGLIALIGSTQAGRVTANWDPVAVLTVGLPLAGAGLAVATAGSLPLIAVGIALLAAGAGVTGPVQKSVVTQLVPADRRAGAVSMAVIAQSVGQTVGPLVMGLIVGGMAVTRAFAVFGVGAGAIGGALLAVAYRRGGAGSAWDGDPPG